MSHSAAGVAARKSRESVSSEVATRVARVRALDHALTANIMWYWSTRPCALYTRLCHCEVNESATTYLGTESGR